MRPEALVHLRIEVTSKSPSNDTGIDTLLHLDLEPDALSLDHDPPRLDLEHTESRGDISFSQELPIDHGFGLRAHHDRIQTHLPSLGPVVGHQVVPLVPLIGLK